MKLPVWQKFWISGLSVPTRIKHLLLLALLLTGCNLPAAQPRLSATQAALETEIAGLQATLTPPAPLPTLTPTVDLLALEPVSPYGLAAYFPFTTNSDEQRGWGENRRMRIEKKQVITATRGNILAFTSGDARAFIPAEPGFNLDGGFTLALFYQLENCTEDCPLLVWSDGQNSGLAVWAHISQYPWPQNSLGMDVVSAIADETSHIVAFPAPPANTWTHLALTYSAHQGKAAIFLDGELAYEKEIGRFEPQTSFPVWVGAHPLQPRARLNGAIDELRIYRRILTPDEIRTLSLQPGR